MVDCRSEMVLTLRLRGRSRFLAFTATLDIPLSCIVAARAGPPGLPAFLELRDYRYDLVMVEVGDAAAAVYRIEQARG